MKNIVIITIILFPISLWGQADSCIQYEKAIDYLKQDSTFQLYFSKTKLRFRVREEVGKGGVSPIMTQEYIAGKLGFDDEADYYRMDSSIVYPMARKVEKEEYSDTTK
jgi:hypothetical protein